MRIRKRPGSKHLCRAAIPKWKGLIPLAWEPALAQEECRTRFSASWGTDMFIVAVSEALLEQDHIRTPASLTCANGRQVAFRLHWCDLPRPLCNLNVTCIHKVPHAIFVFLFVPTGYQLVRCNTALMRKFAFITMVGVAIVCFTRQGNGQGTVSYAPLHLFINGAGGVSPLLDGQMLEVGQSYTMTAIPDSGFAFSSWQPVNVFTFTSYVLDAGGGVSTNISVNASPVPQYINTPSLSFTMEPVEVLFDNPGVMTLTRDSGWQANFEPVPEPSSLALIMCALTATAFLRCPRFYRG